MPPCFAHHQAVHEGKLVIRGRVSSGLVFEHADGRPYGAARTTSDARADAVAALRGAGFTAAEARSAVEAAVSHVGAAPLEDVIRAALRRVREAGCADRRLGL